MGKKLIKPQHLVRIIVGICIMLIIGAIHAFRIGSYLNGDLYIFYYSYASDFIIPFGFYYLLVMQETKIKFLKKWQTKAIIVFGFSTITEIMQLYGFYVLGVTFDVFDIIAFGISIFVAVIFDKIIFQKTIPNWKY